MEQQGIHVQYKGSNMRRLVSDVYDKQNKKKEDCEQVFMIDMKAQISIKGLFDL